MVPAIKNISFKQETQAYKRDSNALRTGLVRESDMMYVRQSTMEGAIHEAQGNQERFHRGNKIGADF